MNYYYVQTNIVCLLILLITAMALNKTNIMPAARRVFNWLIYVCMAICVSDLMAWYFDGNPFRGAIALQEFFNMVYYAAITLEGFVWLVYVNLRLKKPTDYSRQNRAQVIPLLLMLLVVLINPLTHFLFSIDSNGVYSREIGVYFHWFISWGYLFLATGTVIKEMATAKSRTEKKQLFPLVWFVFLPAVAALLQMFFYGLISTQCGLTLSILIIAFNFQSDEISKDVLTGLNNRRALENHFIELLQKYNSNLTVLMCDIDRFKTINDTLGHTAGDLVLKRMAEALKGVCGNYGGNVFLCRYGGDEFIICCNGLDAPQIEALIASLEKSIANLNMEYADELSFGISVGSATGECETYRDVEGLIALADDSMYKVKQAKKAAR